MRHRRPRFETLESRHMLSATVFEHQDIAYFLAQSQPRIDRYDIANEAWLTPIALSGAPGSPTVGLVDDDGIYVAYGAAVYRYNADGTGQTHLLNAQYQVSAIHSDGNLLFLNYSSGLYARFSSINKTTNTVIASITNYVDSVYGSSIAPSVNRIFGRSQGISPADITYIAYRDDGTFVGGGDSPYHGSYPSASKTWVFPGDAKVVDDSGTIYSTSGLTRLNSFGSSVKSIDFLGDNIPVVLSGNTVTAYTSGMLPAGSATLASGPSEIFVNHSDVIAFSVNGTEPTGYRAEIVPLSDLDAPTPGDPVDPVGLAYTPDKVEVAVDGTVLLYSKAHQSIFRWNPATGAYGHTIPLIGTAEYMAYSAEMNTAYLAYASGLIRSVDLGVSQPVEVPFATLPSAPLGLSTAGRYVFAVDASGAWDSHYTFAPDGTLIEAVEWNYYSREYVWNNANQKMYFFRDDTSPNDLLWEEINANGTAYPSLPAGGIGSHKDSPLHTSEGFLHPIRVSPDGSVAVLGSGMIHDAKTLERKVTALANTISDATWLGGQLYTARSVGSKTEYQHWTTPTYGLELAVQVAGTPCALLAIPGTGLLGITISATGIPEFVDLDAYFSISETLTLSPATLPADTVNVPYDQTITASGGTGTLTLAVSNIQGAISGLDIPALGTGSLVISGTPTTTGTETFTVTATDAVGVAVSMNYSITVNSALGLSPIGLPAGSVGDFYSQAIAASGGTGLVTLTVRDLQGAIPGLGMPDSAINGFAIVGVPTASGTETFTVIATDAVGATTSSSFTIVVASPLELSSTSLPFGKRGVAYSQTISASGGIGDKLLEIYGVQGAIPGVTVQLTGLNSLSISGTPTANGTQRFTVVATDSAGHETSADYTIIVSDKTNSNVRVTVSPASLVFGQKATLAATVTSDSDDGGSARDVSPTGWVTFVANDKKIGRARLVRSQGEMIATLTTRKLPIGDNSITAVYEGDRTHVKRTSAAISAAVAKASTALSLRSSANPAKLGGRTTFTATIQVLAPGVGTPTGNIIFLDGTTMLGIVKLRTSGGRTTAVLNTTGLSAGTHEITARFEGDGNCEASISPVLLQVIRTSSRVTAPSPASGTMKVGPALVQNASGAGAYDVALLRFVQENPARENATSLALSNGCVNAVDLALT